MMVTTGWLGRTAGIFAAVVVFVFISGCANTGTAEPVAVTADTPASLTLTDGWKLCDIAKDASNGATISHPGYSAGGWINATVPGTVLTSMVNDGIYPEPLYGENNRPNKIPESLCRTSYWYRTQFAVPADYSGRQVWLNFDGINYIAQVWINGTHIGQISGAFARGQFDVTPYVEPGQTAAVAVLIVPPPHPGTHAEKTVRTGTGPNGGILTEDGATFLCSLGWDWIPTIRDRDIGIWQNVRLAASGPVVLQDPFVESDLPLPRTDSADLTVQATVRNVTNSPQTGTLTGQIEDITFQSDVSLQPGQTRTITFSPATDAHLHVLNPRLWWPNGYGPQNLYKLHLQFTSAGQTSDWRDVTFGIRKITYQLPGSGDLAISVNGVPVMCKGGDWGMDEAMKRISRARLEAQIRMHQEANYNMIRNWVGQSTSEDFYELCDQYGIMVWDEMFQPNPSDGPNVLDTPMYLANVREKVLRFRSHPCIALWCGRNEGDPPPEIDAGIRQIMAELNPRRLYQPNSRDGRGVRSGGPYSWRPPRMFYFFPPSEAFKTEIGSVSIPTLEAVEAMMPQKDWQIVNDDWATHDLTRGAQEGSRRRGGMLFPDIIAQRYGTVVNLADFVRKSQLANYEAFRAMYEGRFARLFSPCTGVITWMSNCSQPTFVWQIYSYDLESNSSLFACRKACEPVHIQMNQSDFHVMVINNKPDELRGLQATISVYNMDGELKSQRRMAVVAAGSAATDLGAVPWPATGLSPVHFVTLELRDARNNPVSDNFYWRNALQPDDYTALQSLAMVPLDAAITRHDDATHCLLDVRLTNSSPTVALMAHLQLRRQESGQRVLPAYYSDNYVSLLPGESRTISVEAAAKDMNGENPVVVLDGWNVTTQRQSFTDGGISIIAPNADAQISPDAPVVFNRPPTTFPFFQ